MRAKDLLMRILLFFAVCAAGLSLWQYLLCPRYSFRTPAPFSGPFWYNPYAGLNTNTQWLKANFHVHSNSWGPFTNGRASKPETIDSLYRYLWYDIPCISDYQSINTRFSQAPGYLPTYEHGYGVGKNHQQVIHAREVSWKDFLLPQQLHNRQYVLDVLRADTGCVVCVNHPEFSGGTPSDFSLLAGYHCMEVMSRLRQSFASWDSALSSGYPAWITANDDGHDIRQPMEAGSCLTLLPAVSGTYQRLAALRMGQSMGVKMPDGGAETPALRKEKLKHLPHLIGASIRQDSLLLEFDRTFLSLTFVGQHGKVLHVEHNLRKAGYRLKSGDSYVRSEIVFGNGVRYYLNPVIRSEGPVFRRPENALNAQATFLYRGLTALGLSLLVFFFYFRKQHVRRAKSNRDSTGL